MKKRANLCFLLIIGLILFSSFNVVAKEKEKDNILKESIKNYVLIADGTDNKQPNYNPDVKCEGDNALLGNVNNEDSVAWLINEILNYLKILGPFVVLVLSSLDYVKAILASDDESLTKAHKNLFTRLILAVALFLLPTLISVVLNVFGITSNEICMF